MRRRWRRRSAELYYWEWVRRPRPWLVASRSLRGWLVTGERKCGATDTGATSKTKVGVEVRTTELTEARWGSGPLPHIDAGARGRPRGPAESTAVWQSPPARPHREGFGSTAPPAWGDGEQRPGKKGSKRPGGCGWRTVAGCHLDEEQREIKSRRHEVRRAHHSGGEKEEERRGLDDWTKQLLKWVPH